MVKAKEFSDFPCRCGHFLPNARAQNFLHARCIAKIRQCRCMKFLRILSGRSAGARKRHISYFSMLLHSKKHGRGICRAPAPCFTFLQAVPAGLYFRLPRSSTVMVVVFGIAVMSLETLIVPSNMAFTSVL